MENLQLTALTLPHTSEKITPSNDGAASDANTDTAAGFQGVLQRLMTLKVHADTPALVETDAGAGEAEEEPSAVMPFGITDATLPPVVTSSINVLSPAQMLAAKGRQPPSEIIASAAHALSSRHTGSPLPDATCDTESTPLATHAAIAAAGPDKGLPRILEQAMESRPGQPVSSYSEHVLEAIAQRRDGPVANMPIPQFMQGLHLPEPAHNFPATHTRIDTPLDTPGWNTEFAQKIVWMAGEKHHLAELHINPPDLGTLNIKLSVSDTQTNAIFTSPHSEVRDAIESALPRLREVLAENGITLGNASVTTNSSRDGSAFDQPQQRQPKNAERRAADAATDPATTHTVIRSRGNGLVDLFA